jgi:hypothetical protein
MLAALAMLLVAPTTWAADTLGHATNGTFPAGGPANAGGGGFGGRGPGGGGPPPGGARGGFPGGAPPTAGGGPRGGGFGGGRGMGFGADSAALTQILSYTRAHGGGTIAVSSQTQAASSIIANGADVAGIGGFSGRESRVSTAWLTARVRSGEIRWILVGGNTGGPPGAQTSTSALDAFVRQHCRRVTGVGSTTGATLYECLTSSV